MPIRTCLGSLRNLVAALLLVACSDDGRDDRAMCSAPGQLAAYDLAYDWSEQGAGDAAALRDVEGDAASCAKRPLAAASRAIDSLGRNDRLSPTGMRRRARGSPPNPESCSAQAVLLELAIKRRAADAQLPHGAGHVAARALQRGLDREALELAEFHRTFHQDTHRIELVFLARRGEVILRSVLVETREVVEVLNSGDGLGRRDG